MHTVSPAPASAVPIPSPWPPPAPLPGCRPPIHFLGGLEPAWVGVLLGGMHWGRHRRGDERAKFQHEAPTLLRPADENDCLHRDRARDRGHAVPRSRRASRPREIRPATSLLLLPLLPLLLSMSFAEVDRPCEKKVRKQKARKGEWNLKVSMQYWQPNQRSPRRPRASTNHHLQMISSEVDIRQCLFVFALQSDTAIKILK